MPRVAKSMMTSSERMDFIYYCSRYPISNEANFQIPQARMYATYLNAHRRDTDEPSKITDHILGYVDESETPDKDPGDMLLRRWMDW